jgi:uncharacterized protein
LRSETLVLAYRFLFLAVALTWLAWIPAALIPDGWVDRHLLIYLGGVGPLIALVAELIRQRGSGTALEFLQRVTDTRALISLPMLAAFCLPVLFAVFGALSSGVMHGAALSVPPYGLVFALALPVLLFGPLPEELAWRGYALPLLLIRHSPLRASLVVASFWSLWHVPLFLIPGTYHAELGLSGAHAWLFFGNLYTQSLIMTALLMASRSPWSAVAYHWMTNLAGEAGQLPFLAELHRSAWTLAAALLVVGLRAPLGIRETRWKSAQSVALKKPDNLI